MQKLKCCECYHEFYEDDLKRYEERHDLSSPPYEVWYGCPYCGCSYTSLS